MTVPRLLTPLVRTRTRLALTLSVLAVALVAATLPWLRSDQAGRKEEAEAAPAVPVIRDEATALAEARSTGKEVLIDTATTATSRSWALPSGQLRSSIHATPQRVANAAGEWTSIDNTLTRAEDAPDGLTVRPVNPPVPVRFSGGSAAAAKAAAKQTPASHSLGQSPRLLPAALTDTTALAETAETVLAEADINGHTIAHTWPGALPEPVLDGPRALYPEVLPGVDLLLVAREEGGFGQLLIVKTSATATVESVEQLTYGLRSETAIFRYQQSTGGVQVLDPDSGQEISSIPTPFGWDSSGVEPALPENTPRTSVATTADVLRLSGLSGSEPGSRHAQLPTRLDGDGTREARLHLDAAATGLLTDTDVTFPVFLDPTLRGGTLAWATVYAQRSSTNTWNGTNFNNGTSDARVGFDHRTPLLTRSFWRMAYTNLRGATVSEATFKVLNNHSWSCRTREIQLWLTGAISSGTTWKKQPSWVDSQSKRSFAHGYGSSCADDYVSFDVLEGAQDGADSGWSNITFGMRATTENDTETWRKFRATSAELEVVYNRPPKEPTNGTTAPGGACVPGPGSGRVVARTNLVLAATGSDPDGNLRGLRFRFWKSGTTVPAGTLVTTLSNGRGSITIPATTLEDNATYSWDVRAEDSDGALSSYFPPGNEPCRVTIDASAPPAPVVESDVFKEATADGATWATVKFGETGPITFTATDAARFSYAFGGVAAVNVTASSGTATVTNLSPRHSGPNTLEVYAYDAAGNQSARTDYTFYVPPRDVADAPGDTGGDGRPDLVVVDDSGNLGTYPGDVDGDLHTALVASYTTGNQLSPAGHWFDPVTGTAALITKYADAYPGDGATDLFVRTPDGRFWLYPGDGYGSFNVDRRLRVLLPANTPDPATWTQIKAVGDITGDKLPDLVVRVGTAFWTLVGYTGAGFQHAWVMEATAWGGREIVNLADIDLDGTPDLLWRDLTSGDMYLRHGKPGTVSGSVDLESLKLAVNSREGDVRYGTNWSASNITGLVGIPDVNGDQVPDLWARASADGQIRVYHASTTNTGGPVKVVLSNNLSGIKAFG